jgi:hypothetical protein
MNDLLPITIQIDRALAEKFSKIKSVSSKLEAQFNFQTLTANWYGDEENILMIQLALETPESFADVKEALALPLEGDIQIYHFSDDVICCASKADLQLLCHIAITDSELDLLEQQGKLLAGFLQAKLHKVLNLIAQQESLTHI